MNNAGGAQTKSIMKWTEEEWLRVMALNLGSVWFLSRAAVKPMLAQGKGAIVNISSGASLLAMPQAAPYGAAKAGVNNLTGSMAAAWTGKGVRVNAIAVGAVRAASLLDDADRYGLDPDAIGMTNASGRLGEPEEIGYGVLFFASDASSFCSGPDALHARRPRAGRRLTLRPNRCVHSSSARRWSSTMAATRPSRSKVCASRLYPTAKFAAPTSRTANQCGSGTLVMPLRLASISNSSCPSTISRRPRAWSPAVGNKTS